MTHDWVMFLWGMLGMLGVWVCSIFDYKMPEPLQVILSMLTVITWFVAIILFLSDFVRYIK